MKNKNSHKDNSHSILKKLVKMSAATYGIISFNNDFNSSFNIPEQELYNNLLLLNRKQLIEVDNINIANSEDGNADNNEFAFSELYIMPDGYRCVEEHKNNAISISISTISIIVAVASFVVFLFK